MKKSLPYIFSLIAISLIGLVYLQVVWINNAISVQEIKYKNEILNSLYEIRNDLIIRTTKALGRNPATLNYDDTHVQDYIASKIDYLNSDQVKESINNHLKNNNIELDFEFALIQNQLGFPVLISQSYGFDFTADLNTMPQISIDRENKIILFIKLSEPRNYVVKRASWLITTSIVLTLMIFASFIIIIYILFKQKKVGEIKSDFINNMTHEFKTPLATISLAVDALNTDKIQGNTEKLKYFTSIIKEETQRLNKQVQKILEAAKMERDNIELNLQPLRIHPFINNAVKASEINIAEKNGKISTQLLAKNDLIEGDEVHISNIIYNLIDNAIKYSKENLEIKIITHSTRTNIIIKVEDNGIGMTKETMSHVFEKFYRAHTGNVHNVKGFGLGLSYVQTVVSAHKGKIKVESTLGKGSTFIVELPILRSN